MGFTAQGADFAEGGDGGLGGRVGGGQGQEETDEVKRTGH